MLIYWLLLGFTAMPALTARARVGGFRPGLIGLLLAVVIVALIGLRYAVGGDWNAYELTYRQIAPLSVGSALTVTDPAYALLDWLAAQLGLGQWAVNLVCAALFTLGLFRFAFGLPNPWLGIVAAVPYLIVVVAMGYTRQSVALGFIMLGLVSIRQGSFLKFMIYAFVAATFHKSAVLVVPLVVLAYSRHRAITFTLGGLLLPIFYYLLLASSVDSLVSNYVGSNYGSRGAVIRVLMNLPPALILVFNQDKFFIGDSERKMWRNLAIAAILFVPAVLASAATTWIDRLALYLLPLQIFVAGWLPVLFSRARRSDAPLALAVTVYSALVLFVWLTYADNSRFWVPYRFLPFEN